MYRLQRIVFATFIAVMGMFYHEHFIYFSDYRFNLSYSEDILINFNAFENIQSDYKSLLTFEDNLKILFLSAEILFFFTIEHSSWFIYFFLFWYLLPLEKSIRTIFIGVLGFFCIASYNQVLFSACLYLILVKFAKFFQYSFGSFAIILTPISTSFFNIFRSIFALPIIASISILFYVMFWIPERVDWLFLKSGSIEILSLEESFFSEKFYFYLLIFYLWILITKKYIYGFLVLVLCFLLAGGNFGLASKYYLWFLFFFILGQALNSEKNF
jgi:hypothetical protein